MSNRIIGGSSAHPRYAEYVRGRSAANIVLSVMETLFSHPLLSFLLLILIAPTAVTAATGYNARDRNYGTDVSELTQTLLSYRGDPLADEDKWSAIPSDALRQAWTDANRVIPSSNHVSDLLKVTKRLQNSAITVHVDVQIVAPDNFISVEQHSRIIHYATAMRAGRNGTSLNFTVSISPKHVYNRIALHPPSENPTNFSTFLDQAAKSSGAVNVLYVIINPHDHPVSDYAAPLPFLGNSRAAWFLYAVEKRSELFVSDLLVATERAAERVFAPAPMYFPLPFIRELQVYVTVYTPGMEHRAPWLQNFAWDQFEAAVRAHAIRGQNVRFVSSQTNAGCKKCQHAFHGVQNPSLKFVSNAVTMLNNDVAPYHTWASSVSRRALRKLGARDIFRLFVLDTSNVRKGDATLQRLERRSLFVFPGIAIIIIRASDRATKLNLPTTMLRAVVSGVFGIAEPALYIPARSSATNTVVASDASTPVLTDIVTRNFVRSVFEQRITELEEIVDGMVYFEVEPSISLEERDYIYFSQTVNLMIFRMKRAQGAISDFNDGPLAVYLAAATDHDIKAIRSAFDIEDEESTLMRFRDPTIRCHFSRLKREALRVSEIIETTYPSVKPVIIALATFTVSAVTTKAALLQVAAWKSPRKRE